MSLNNIWNNENLIKILKENGIAVMPTDTIYGIVGRALNKDVVKKIYKIRKRNPEKPCVILIGDVNELKKFSIGLSKEQKKLLQNFWPGPVSIVLYCPDKEFEYLYRSLHTLAFRVPSPRSLQELLLKVGPLIAPSANMEKFPVSENIEDAQKYFGDKVDMYVDGGLIGGKASKIVRLHKDGSVSIIRQ
jgi:L-threonylcarbamoyladenylate synthase